MLYKLCSLGRWKGDNFGSEAIAKNIKWKNHFSLFQIFHLRGFLLFFFSPVKLHLLIRSCSWKWPTFQKPTSNNREAGKWVGKKKKWLQIQLFSSDLLVTDISINLVFKWVICLLVQSNILKAYQMGYSLLIYSVTIHTCLPNTLCMIHKYIVCIFNIFMYHYNI